MIIQNNQQTRRKEVEEREKQLLKMIRKQPEEEKDLLKNAVKKEIRKKHRRKTKYMKVPAVAACALIIAPTTIYGKEIQKFFQSKWKQNIFRMEVQVTKEKKSKQNVAKKQEISKGYGDGITYQIQKIKVCDSVKGLSSENKKWRNNDAQSQLRKITDNKGKFQSYQRKTIIYGDGFHAPEQRIGKSQEMNTRF